MLGDALMYNTTLKNLDLSGDKKTNNERKDIKISIFSCKMWMERRERIRSP